MNDEWICPRCETLNNGKDCAVCGMGREDAIAFYEKKIDNPIKTRIIESAEPEMHEENKKEYKRWHEDDVNMAEVAAPKKRILSIITVLLSIFGLLVCISSPAFSLIIATVAIVIGMWGIVKDNVNSIVLCGLVLVSISILCDIGLLLL